MKHSISVFCVLMLVVALVSSCKVKDEVHETPTITTSYFYVNPLFDENGKIIGAADTLLVGHMIGDKESGTYVLDTINLVDSVQVLFAASFLSHGNNLVSTHVNFDTAQFKLRLGLTSDIMAATIEPTDTAKGQLYYRLGYNAVSFPISYTPRQTGDLQLSLVVYSDAGEPYSPAAIRLVQPVK
ncbi:MAG: hypothetical protein IJU36_08320 [Paludibacteraceae bacterium]|nr:hypothetical protein [Paludibacteraceae bacterium]